MLLEFIQPIMPPTYSTVAVVAVESNNKLELQPFIFILTFFASNFPIKPPLPLPDIPIFELLFI